MTPPNKTTKKHPMAHKHIGVAETVDITLMGFLSTVHTWRVRVRYDGNPAGPLKGYEFVDTDGLPPRHGSRLLSMFGWATIQSKRPKRMPEGFTREELKARD